MQLSERLYEIPLKEQELGYDNVGSVQETWDHREVGSFLAWNLASSEGIDGSWRQLKENVGWTRMQRYLTKHKHAGKVDVLLVSQEEPTQHQIWELKWDGQEASGGPFQDQIWGLELGGQEASDGQAASVALEGQEKPVRKISLTLKGSTLRRFGCWPRLKSGT